jgi:hypothetical protein
MRVRFFFKKLGASLPKNDIKFLILEYLFHSPLLEPCLKTELLNSSLSAL